MGTSPNLKTWQCKEVEELTSMVGWQEGKRGDRSGCWMLISFSSVVGCQEILHGTVEMRKS